MMLIGPYPAEYVIFNPAQVLPMYRVTFHPPLLPVWPDNTLATSSAYVRI